MTFKNDNRVHFEKNQMSQKLKKNASVPEKC